MLARIFARREISSDQRTAGREAVAAEKSLLPSAPFGRIAAPELSNDKTIRTMFTRVPQVEAFARLRCVDCGFVFAAIGEPADKIIYGLFFGGLKLKDRVQAVCPSCKNNSATIEDADYVMPSLVK